MKKLFLLMFLLLVIPTIAGADIGTFKQADEIQIYQTCNNCTYCNFTSIKYPNGSTLLSNVITTQDDTYYYYDLTTNYTNSVGTYRYCYDCGNNVESETGCIDFSVNPQGFELNQGQGTIYAISLIVVFLLFLLTLYYGLQLPWKNERTPEGNILYIDYKKYLKFALMFVSYLILVFFFAIGKGMSYTFLQSTEAYGFFNVGFSVLLIGIMPVAMLSLVFIIMGALFDKKVQKALIRGIPVR